MKKQINPNIKAHLIRSSFYVLLLLAVCVIPFALAQRNTSKRSVPTRPKVAATKIAANKAQLAAQLERSKSVPSALVGKRHSFPMMSAVLRPCLAFPRFRCEPVGPRARIRSPFHQHQEVWAEFYTISTTTIRGSPAFLGLSPTSWALTPIWPTTLSFPGVTLGM